MGFLQRLLPGDLTRRKRDIDLIKTVAIFSIVCIHSCCGGYWRPIGSLDWVSTVFWGCLTRAGVPLFFMCSGALMLDPDKPLTLKTLYGRYLPRLLLALFVWAGIYGVVRLSLDHELSAAALLQLGKDLLLFRHEQHLYFLHIILLTYVLLPVTRSFVRSAARRTLEYALAVWFATGILFPTLLPYEPFSRLQGIPLQWGLNMTWAAVGYGLLGWYLRAYPAKRRSLFAWLAALSLTALFAGTWLLSVRKGAFDSSLLGGMHVLVCLMAAGVFGLCVGAKPGSWAVFFSRASFCIYLSHMLFLLLFQQIPFTALSACCLWSIPILTLAVCACSTLLYLVLCRIPFVKRWLV